MRHASVVPIDGGRQVRIEPAHVGARTQVANLLDAVGQDHRAQRHVLLEGEVLTQHLGVVAPLLERAGPLDRSVE
eukprot:scaffold19548_cov50-Phaeocystis_antarctica.AAC.2